jgi:hypothetical protein
MPATPDTFRLCQNPLGAYLLPQALTSVALSRHRGTLSIAQAGFVFLGSRRFPRSPILPRGILSFDVSHAALL